MRHFTKLLVTLIALPLTVGIVSCSTPSSSDAPSGTDNSNNSKAGSISYATTTVSKTTDDTAFTNELTKTGDGTVTYASSKTDVATVNETTGKVTIVAAGETVITATVADSDTYTYATKTASYTLTVTAADTTRQKSAGSISYATASVSKTTDSTAFTNELTKTGDGTVSYASSKTDVAEVNATTGEVIIKGAGTATITATVTDSASYTYATKTASYTLTVTVAGISVTGITISNAPTEALFVNSTGTLTATVSPANATDKTIVWSSSDSDYVSINAETGEYTIMGTKGYGSATITATATNGTEDTSDDVTATCTITGKVTYTSLKAGDVLHVGDTFYTGSTVYFAGNTNVTFPTTAGVITIVEATKDGYNGKFYQFKRSSNGTWPNWSYSVKDNTDGVYITGGSGTSSGDRFTLAVHTKE